MYSIRTAARAAGLSPSAIRAWERRFEAVVPSRTAGGHRVYSQSQLRRLQGLAALTRAGHRIGDIAAWSDDEIARAAASTDVAAGLPSAASGDLLARLEANVRAFDARNLRNLLFQCILSFEPAQFMEAVVSPLLTTTGEKWQSGELSVGQEHFLTQVFSEAIACALDLNRHATRGPVIVLATLPGERHALGCLCAAYIAATSGWAPLFIGPDLPPDQIAGCVVSLNATALGISIVNSVIESDRTLEDLGRLAMILPKDIHLWLGGRGTASIPPPDLPARCDVFTSLSAFGQALHVHDTRQPVA